MISQVARLSRRLLGGLPPFQWGLQKCEERCRQWELSSCRRRTCLELWDKEALLIVVKYMYIQEFML